MTRLAAWVAALSLWGLSAGAASAQTMTLTSPDIKAGETIANEQVFKGFGCKGDNLSPALSWSGAPAGTKSFALTVYDPDAPTGSGWWHWVVFNIPARNRLAAQGRLAIRSGKLLPEGAIQSRTDFGAPRLWWTVPAARRQAAPLPHHGFRDAMWTSCPMPRMSRLRPRWWGST